MKRAQLTFAFAEKAIVRFYYENGCTSSIFIGEFKDSHPQHLPSHYKVKRKQLAQKRQVTFSYHARSPDHGDHPIVHAATSSAEGYSLFNLGTSR
jgi:hypothetical protein